MKPTHLTHTPSPTPTHLVVSNPTSSPLTIPKGTIIATFNIRTGSATQLILPCNKASTRPTRRSSLKKRFQIFHTDSKTIIIDHKRPDHPRALRINRPLNVALHQPDTSSSPSSSTTKWKSHTIHEDESLTESPVLQQSSPSSAPQTSTSNTNTTDSPRPPPTSRVNSSTRKHVHVTIDQLRQSIGFLGPDKLLRKLDILGNGHFSVSSLPRNPKLDPGEAASINAPRRNTTPSTPPPSYSDTWHVDIGYGPCTAHGGIKYTLLFVDKATRYKRIYPLKNLTTSLLRATKRFFKDCKVKPKLIRTDFDKKSSTEKSLNLLRKLRV